MHASTSFAALLLAIVLTGCARDAPSMAAPAGTDDPAPASPAPLSTPGADADSSSPPSPSTAATLALSGAGLDVVEPGSGATRHLAFGLDMDRVIDTLVRVRGRPQERFDNPECGAGPLQSALWADGLGVQFQDGRFVGWGMSARGGDTAPQSGPTTVEGLGLGSTRAELEAAYATQVFGSTLGTEFSAGGLHGLLESPRSDAKVMSLWAGTTCIFR